MKGIVFNIFEDFITENFGIETWNEVLEKAELRSGKIFVAPASYPDDDFLSLVTTAVDLKGLDLSEAVRMFGRYTFGKLAERYSELVSPYRTAKDFLLKVDSIIHVEVKKLFSDAEPPSFTYEDPAKDRLIMHYNSRRRLCLFMEGLLEGVAEHFKTRIDYRQVKCMNRNDSECIFDMKFE
jgi:hypothetical protein